VSSSALTSVYTAIVLPSFDSAGPTGCFLR